MKASAFIWLSLSALFVFAGCASAGKSGDAPANRHSESVGNLLTESRTAARQLLAHLKELDPKTASSKSKSKAPRSAAPACLEIGRLDVDLGVLARLFSEPGDTFESARKDTRRAPLASAQERVTSLTGFCGELSGETVAGYRYMPKPQASLKELPRVIEIAQGLVEDLETFK